METIFINKLNKTLKKNEWLSKDESQALYDSYILNKVDNEKILVENFKEIIKSNNNENRSKLYIYSNFISYLWEYKSFTNNDIIWWLKTKLDYFISSGNYEDYSYFLKILFSINSSDNKYYIEQYDIIKEKKKLYHDINASFLEIFIKFKNNDYFIEAFKQIIIDNTNHIYPFSLKDWFKYLFWLKSEFKKYFLNLLEYFNDKDIKRKLVKHHEYTSLIRSYDKKDFVEIFNIFHKTLDSAKFTKKEIKLLKNFIINDVNFAFDNYERKITENFFINEFFKYFYNQDKWFLIELLKWLWSRYVISGWDDLAVNYLTKKYVEDFVKLYKWTDNSNLIYFTYDRLKYAWKTDIINAFEKSSIKEEIVKRNKILEENKKKSEQEEEKRKQKEKNLIFSMLEPEEWHYYPKLFQDYSEYLKDRDKINKLFTKDEIKKINKSVINQIKTLFKIIEIEDYNDEKISKILTFERTAENSYRHTWYSSYLSWIIEISKSLKIDLSKYYKYYVLFYPLLWWTEKIEDTLNIIWNNLKSEDIDYILKVYSEDLHDNAKDLRYYHIDTLSDFYNKFKDKFNLKQNKRLENICLDVINWDEENNIYYKQNFLKIYSIIWWENKLIKLWNLWKKKFPNFNYFKNVLDSEVENSERDKMKFLIFITKELIKTYWNRTAINWSLKQLKEWKIEAVDNHKIEYPRTSASFSWLSEKESELWRWWRDEYNFSNIFSTIPKIDILDDLIDILNLSFRILSDLENWKIEWNYEMYAYYLRRIFYIYIENIDDKLVYKDYYYKIKDLLKKYNSSITYNFDLDTLRKKFNIDNLEEEAKEVVEVWWIEWVKKILKYKETDLNKTWEYKYLEIIKWLEEENFKLNEKIKGSEEIELSTIELEKIENENESLKNKNTELIKKNKTLRELNKKISDDNKKYIENNNNLLQLSKLNDYSCILIVEWESDKILLDIYFDYLKDKWEINNSPLIVIWNGSRGVSSLLDSNKKYSSLKPILWLFDFDKEWVESYYKLNKSLYSKVANNTHYDGLIKKHNSYNIYWLLLPVPKDWVIENQVIKDKLSSRSLWEWEEENPEIVDFWIESKLEIEHLFYNILSNINNDANNELNKFLFEEEKSVWGWKIIKLKISDSKKVEFAEKIREWKFFTDQEKYFDQIFRNFKPILDTITNITGQS